MHAVSSRASHCHDRDGLAHEEVSETVGSLVRGPALTLPEYAPISEAGRLFVEHRVAAIAIVDGLGDLRGVVTRTDVLRTDDPTTPVAELMSMFVFALPADASIHRAASLIAFEGIGQVVVTGPCRLVIGIVSAVDITRYFATTATMAR